MEQLYLSLDCLLVIVLDSSTVKLLASWWVILMDDLILWLVRMLDL